MDRTERLARPKSRERVLSDAERTNVWRACEGAGVFGKIVHLCILLGQRRSEIAHLEWAWFNESDLTAVLLATIPRDKYLVPARKTWRQGGTIYNAWNKDKPRLDAASGVDDWVLHDLRRTFVSSWAALGTRLEVTEKYINHVSGTHGGIVGVYQRHTFMPEMREALGKWEAKLTDINPTQGLTSASLQ